MLTRFQERVARAIGALPAAGGFALGGGAALIAHRVVERSTNDLDYFAGRPEEVLDALVPVEVALTAAGLAVERIRAEPGFARLRVASGSEECLVDLVAEPHLRPAQPGPVGPMLSLEDVAAGKVLALFDRARGRDFVDVHALANRFSRERLCELAEERDLGLDRGVLAEMIGTIGRLPRDEFDVDDETFVRVQAFFHAWREELAPP